MTEQNQPLESGSVPPPPAPYTPEALLAKTDIPATELRDLASQFPELHEAIKQHPNVYPGLVTWIEQQNAPAVTPVVANEEPSAAASTTETANTATETNEKAEENDPLQQIAQSASELGKGAAALASSTFSEASEKAKEFYRSDAVQKLSVDAPKPLLIALLAVLGLQLLTVFLSAANITEPFSGAKLSIGLFGESPNGDTTPGIALLLMILISIAIAVYTFIKPSRVFVLITGIVVTLFAVINLVIYGVINSRLNELSFTGVSVGAGVWLGRTFAFFVLIAAITLIVFWIRGRNKPLPEKQ